MCFSIQNEVNSSSVVSKVLLWVLKEAPPATSLTLGASIYCKNLNGQCGGRYLLLGGAVGGGASLAKQYEEWKNNLPDTAWIKAGPIVIFIYLISITAAACLLATGTTNPIVGIAISERPLKTGHE